MKMRKARKGFVVKTVMGEVLRPFEWEGGVVSAIYWDCKRVVVRKQNRKQKGESK